ERISAASIIADVERFGEEQAFANKQDVHLLILHLTAVSHFETKEQPEKVVKHMESFIVMLDHMKGNDMISEEAYDSLRSDAETLIEKWERTNIISTKRPT